MESALGDSQRLDEVLRSLEQESRRKREEKKSTGFENAARSMRGRIDLARAVEIGSVQLAKLDWVQEFFSRIDRFRCYQ